MALNETIGDPAIEPVGLRASAVAKLLRPKSVVVVGVSSKPGSAGQNAVAMLEKDNFAGEIFLVGRSGGTIGGRPVLAGIDELPQGVDLAILTLPASGVRDAIEGCVRRGVGSAVVFASGFAETGEDARAEQAELTRLADEAGLGIVGPNCLGFTNYVDGLDVGFVGGAPLTRLTPEQQPAVAIVAQSGGIMGLVHSALEARRVATAYRISTGNEAGLGLSDYISHFATNPAVGSIVMYAEHIRHPAAFLEAAAKARAAGKTLVMMHTGRGQRARTAAASHTGALAGDYATMKTLVQRAGVLVAESIEELVDCTELLARYPEPPVGDPAVATTSGALCAIAHDCADDLGLELPPLSPESLAILTPRMPEFTPPKNPLDLTTQVIWDAPLTADATKVLLDDPAMGSVTIAVPVGPDASAVEWLRPLLEVAPRAKKPVQLAILSDEAPWPPNFERMAREGGMMMVRSPERALRTIARATEYGRALARKVDAQAHAPLPDLPQLGSGPQPEWLGKQVLKALGLKVPAGGLAKTADEAVAIAARVGFPVALKVQAAELAHKTEIGGVLLGLADEAGVRDAYAKLVERATAAKPGVALDGVLVEKMAKTGQELVVGASRDPQWGPVVLVGLGGILVEAIGDVRLLPTDLTREDIVAELRKLKSAKLLGAFRGRPASDLEAVADVVMAVGRLMNTRPEISEIDINPLMALPEGEGAVALDALVVTR